MGYISSSELDSLCHKEQFLVNKMWSVLTQSVYMANQTTLGSLKRFIFVIEGLSVD